MTGRRAKRVRQDRSKVRYRYFDISKTRKEGKTRSTRYVERPILIFPYVENREGGKNASDKIYRKWGYFDISKTVKEGKTRSIRYIESPILIFRYVEQGMRGKGVRYDIPKARFSDTRSLLSIRHPIFNTTEQQVYQQTDYPTGYCGVFQNEKFRGNFCTVN